jgi:HlyD family secretion protein
MKKWGIRFLVVLALVGAGYALNIWVWAPKPLTVSTVLVERGRVEQTVTNTRAGTVTARQRAKLSPEIGGRVVEIPHRKGATVHAGDILLRLNDDTQQAAVQMAERELAVVEVRRERACLEAARAKREYLRNQQLRERDLVSTDFLDKIENVAQTTAVFCKQAQVEITKARSAIVEAKATMAKTVLRAPFDGVVAEVDIEVGEWTTPSPPVLPVPPVMDLIDPTSMYVSAPMDEVDSSKIRQEQPVRVTLDPFPGKYYSGHVHRISSYVLDIEEQNRTVEIEVELDDRAFAARLLPGTSADVEVILSVKEDVLRIPTSALFEGQKVFVVENKILQLRPIAIGLKNWDFVEIVDGLSESDVVVISLDQEGLGDGKPVVVRSSSEPQ